MITTKRLIMKPFEEHDENDVSVLLCNEIIKKTFMVPDFKNREQAAAMFKKLKELSEDAHHFVNGIYLNKKLIGFINDTDVSDNTIELGCVIHPKFHNKGFASEAIQAAIQYLFKHGYRKVKAGAFASNKASCHMMEKCGMKRTVQENDITYRGEVHHCVYYEIEDTAENKERKVKGS